MPNTNSLMASNMTKRSIAYFSMEIALESAIPTYSGGLGVLAGDTLRSAADAGLPLVGVTLLSRHGYFRQLLDENGNQSEQPVRWPIDDYLVPVDVQVSVTLEQREVAVRAWRYDIIGYGGDRVPVFLLDTDCDDNSDYDRKLTDQLYGGDAQYRLCQEAILGIGGIRVLRALGYNQIDRYHMNEGHSSLLIFELLDELKPLEGGVETKQDRIARVRQLCVFTTHTPVAAGHDRFPQEMAYRILKKCNPFQECADELCCDHELNLTYLALEASHYVNGVAKKHRETSQKMFSGYRIDSITNGVHALTWTSDAMRDLFDKRIPDWRSDNSMLRYAISIERNEIFDAHQAAKQKLVEYANKVSNAGMDQRVMTIGFARRATQYKRATMIFSNPERLKQIAHHCGKLQIIFAGKAHPHDDVGKSLIKEIHAFRDRLNRDIRITYLPDYDMEIGRLITSGVDLWLNTPLPPLEASGTSGMKAAINGVPSLSILDGWWIEGCIEGVTGWAITNPETHGSTEGAVTETEPDILYSKLENTILPMYYHDRDTYISVMRNAIAINGSFFNTERMMNQYVTKAYFK